MKAVILLAAGQGTRMNSKRQKILHEVGGRPMVMHAFLTAVAVADLKPVLVVGPGEAGVRDLIGERADYVIQPEQLGTGHAALMAKEALDGRAEQVIVTYGDMPLLRPETLTALTERQAETGAAVVMLACLGDPASSFGRVIRNEAGRVTAIMEAAQARREANAADLLAIREQNVGVYCFDGRWLWENIPHLPLRQARSGPEYYLTDMVETAVQQDRLVEAILLQDDDESLGAGTRAELVAVEKAFRRRANQRWLAAGVTLIDPETTYIDPDVVIGRDTVIWPNSYVQGGTVIGEDCLIGPNAILRNAIIGDGVEIVQAVIEGVVVAPGRRVPPFTHLQEG
jgi:bifunctional UDP-N-acetylglucosamine pyrophosphorylase / glucosamine-1-phosphate N-acetyltransferase